MRGSELARDAADFACWQEFYDATGFDPEEKFADRYPYIELVELLYPYDSGTFYNLVIYGFKVGIVPGERAFSLRYAHEKEELPPCWKPYIDLDTKLKKFYFPFKKEKPKKELLYRHLYRIEWSDRDEDIFFAQKVRQALPWNQVDRRQNTQPFGVIRLELDKSRKTLVPKEWRRNKAGRWVPEQPLR